MTTNIAGAHKGRPYMPNDENAMQVVWHDHERV